MTRKVKSLAETDRDVVNRAVIDYAREHGSYGGEGRIGSYIAHHRRTRDEIATTLEEGGRFAAEILAGERRRIAMPRINERRESDFTAADYAAIKRGDADVPAQVALADYKVSGGYLRLRDYPEFPVAVFMPGSPAVQRALADVCDDAYRQRENARLDFARRSNDWELHPPLQRPGYHYEG